MLESPAVVGRRWTLAWPVLMFVIVALFYWYEFLLRVSPSVLVEELLAAFHMDASTFGFFSSCWYWAYAPLQLPVGALTDKYGPRRLLTCAILVCAFSTIALSYTHDFYIGCLMRALLGAGSAFAFIGSIKIVHLWFRPSWFSWMTGLTLTAGTLGAAMGGTPLSLALLTFSWRDLLLGMGIVGIVLALLAWTFIRDHNPLHPESLAREKAEPGFWECLCAVMKQPQSWIVGLYAFFVTAPTDAIGGTWGVKFLVEAHGISLDMASFAAVTMTFAGMAVGSPLLGWIAGYWDNRKTPMMISSGIAALALTAIVFWPHLTGPQASCLFFVFGASGTYVLAFVMTRRFADSIYVATAVGFVNMVSMLGSAFLTYAVGRLLDMAKGVSASGSSALYAVTDYHYSLLLLPLFYVISACFVVPFIQEEKR